MKKLIFESRVAKLEQNVYSSLKGTIRLELLSRDIAEYCANFSGCKPEHCLNVLDVGGGSGRFARVCAEKGHKVTLCDISKEMLSLEASCNGEADYAHKIELLEADFLEETIGLAESVDLVLMHGSAEWMAAPPGRN